MTSTDDFVQGCHVLLDDHHSDPAPMTIASFEVEDDAPLDSACDTV